MKTSVAVLAMLMTAPALANSNLPTNARVPTGYQVKGSTYYVLETGTANVVQIDCDRAYQSRDLRVQDRCVNLWRGGAGGADGAAAESEGAAK